MHPFLYLLLYLCPMSRAIKHIVLHCTGTQPTAKVSSIERYWRETMKWKSPGYHFIIEANGNFCQLLSTEKPSNGVKGHNHDSIHISYIGGIDKHGKAMDTRTAEQIETMIDLIRAMKAFHPDADICGHRDFPNVRKDCPSFDVKTWLKSIQL